ncbi:hypothetical protein KRX51_01525 [Corynebacterium sp. TAE3-ERU12]|uniref:hypothetical protein n=1 Tax=Corynebacterium sp. TAE3-ERU12 TaxID=2849491 RepID=UPI001C49533E|nr:hypothetical protein [Corynebacterium sp. TAE3-ERU12]MBV7294596.1 hypothetical protein [Corynebacterium sp. TAE3-ERU12]
MTSTTVFLNRFAAFLLGAVLLAAGIAGLYFGVDEVIDLPKDVAWWVLLIIAIASIVIALWLFVINVSRKSIDTVIDGASDGTGTLIYDPKIIADAVAKELETAPGVRRANGTTKVIQGRDTITVTIDQRHRADPAPVLQACEQAHKNILEAVENPIAVRFLLRVDADD